MVITAHGPTMGETTMPLNAYGVLSARVTDIRRETGDTPHYQIHLVDNDNRHYRAAVNVQSSQQPSDLLYFAADNFQHPLTTALPPAGSGWNKLASQPGGAALDYIRANILTREQMRPVPPDAEGPNNDLADFLDHYVRRAQHDPTATAYLYGEPWGPEDTPDKIFGFTPGAGVHNIHMNQGNDEQFQQDDGVWQDGGMLLHFAGENRWVAVFLAFQTQSWHTDDETGHPLPAETTDDGTIRVVAAMVNPVGGGRENETITLLNTADHTIDLTGWTLTDTHKNTMPIPVPDIAAGQTLQIPATDDFHLGNHGGQITVLNPRGTKVHGVTYTAAQADTPGRTVQF